MRWLLTMALLAIMASPALAQENEAEKLVRSMAQRVRAAKTLRLRFDLSVTDSDAKTGTLKGALILGEGDKFWAQGEGKPFDKAVKFTIVNDGVTMKTTGSTPKQEKTENSPKTVGIYLRRTLPRAGFFVCFSTIDRLEDLESDPFKMAEFKLAGQEKIGTRNTQAIQWIVTENGKKTVSMKLWVDTQTNLPVKLAMTGGQAGVSELTETYSEFTLDAKVDAKIFQLPK